MAALHEARTPNDAAPGLDYDAIKSKPGRTSRLIKPGGLTGAVVTYQRSLASRAGYNPGDPIISVITCQLQARCLG